MGWSAGEEKEIYSLDELIEKFSLEGVHRSSAIFNYEPNNPKRWTDDKPIWMNAEYIRTMPLADLLPLVKAELKATNCGAKNTTKKAVALEPTIPSTADLGPDERPPPSPSTSPEHGSHDWFVQTVDLIRARFFHAQRFFVPGPCIFQRGLRFRPGGGRKESQKIPDLKTGCRNSPSDSKR